MNCNFENKGLTIVNDNILYPTCSLTSALIEIPRNTKNHHDDPQELQTYKLTNSASGEAGAGSVWFFGPQVQSAEPLHFQGPASPIGFTIDATTTV